MKNDLNQRFKNDFDRLDLSKEISDKIQRNIINTYNKNKRIKRIVLSVSTIFFIVLFGVSVTYADEIKEAINSFVYKKEHRNESKEFSNYTINLESDVRKIIKEDAKMNDPKCVQKLDRIYGFIGGNRCYTIYTPSELEGNIGIQLLNSMHSKKKDYILYKVTRNDEGKIKWLVFRIANLFEQVPNKNKEFENKDELLISIEALVRTKYSDTKDDTYLEYVISDDTKVKEYYIKNINTKAYIVKYNQEKNILSGTERRHVFFFYDDIGYKLDISSLGNNENLDERIYNFLETLSY